MTRKSMMAPATVVLSVAAAASASDPQNFSNSQSILAQYLTTVPSGNGTGYWIAGAHLQTSVRQSRPGNRQDSRAVPAVADRLQIRANASRGLRSGDRFDHPRHFVEDFVDLLFADDQRRHQFDRLAGNAHHQVLAMERALHGLVTAQARRAGPPRPVAAAIRFWYNPGLSSRKFYGPGIFVMVISMFPPLLATLAMAKEGEQKTILQVFVSNVSAQRDSIVWGPPLRTGMPT